MKLLTCLAIILMVAFGGMANAGEIEFNWNQEITTDFAGWRLYQAPAAGGSYELALTIMYDGNSSEVYSKDLTIPVVVGGPVDYFFVLTAFDTAGNESGNSNEVKYTATDTTPPGEPQTLTVTVKQE